MPANPLATFALAVQTLVDTSPGSTDTLYENAAHGSTDTPGATLNGTASPSIYTDTSGWVDFALASVAPIHGAVAAAEQTDALFNPGQVQAFGSAVTINEAQQPWARADVLSYFFGNIASGSDGFTSVNDFSTLSAGDVVAFATGIYTDPSNPNAATDPTLTATSDTGQAMIVVGNPVAVPQADWQDTTGSLSGSVASVVAVGVVDGSSTPHFADLPGFTEPLADTRSYAAVAANPPNLPPGVSQSELQPGGVGAGTVWFALDATGAPIQYRYNQSSPWVPNGGTAALIRAGRPTGGIDLSGSMLDANGRLVVNAFANATPVLNGTAYDTQPEALTGSGGLLVQGGGSVKLFAGNSFTGGVNLRGATVELAGAGAAGTSGVSYLNGFVSRLVVDSAAALPTGTVADLDVGDSVDLSYLTYASGLATLAAGTLTVTAGAGQASFAATAGSQVRFSTRNDGHNGTLVTAACFASGTRILTTQGEIAVEHLRVGDRVPTLCRGRTAPIRWIGHTTLDAAAHPRPWTVNPVRVRAGAFGAEQPRRDLVLSPEHAVYVAGVLVPIRCLVNDATVVQERAGRITYWHVELDRHDVIFAEAMPAESFLDTGNRGAFDNAPTAEHPGFAPRDRDAWALDACAVLVEGGPELETIRADLAERAHELGLPVRPPLDVALRGVGRVQAHIPAGTTRVRLLSSTHTPAGERRRLGAAIGGLLLGDSEMRLGGEALASGFHEVEGEGDILWRWSDGEGILRLAGSPEPRMLVIDVIQTAALLSCAAA